MLVLECHDGRPFWGLRGIERIDELDLHVIQPKFCNGLDHHFARLSPVFAGPGAVPLPYFKGPSARSVALTSSVPSTADAFTRPSTSISGIVFWPGQPSGSYDHPEHYVEQRYIKFFVASIYLFIFAATVLLQKAPEEDAHADNEPGFREAGAVVEGSAAIRFYRSGESAAMPTSFVTVFMLRAVPFSAAGTRSFERAMPSS